MGKRAVVLLSGGLDSTTVLAMASKRDGYDCYALSFDYQQRHQVELEYAAIQAKLWNVKEHRVIKIGMEYMTHHNADASLVNLDAQVPEMRDESEMTDIPSTYVPARNTVFLGYAVSYAEVLGAEKIYIGVNVLDYSGYPDCRPEYIFAYQDMLAVATKQGIEGNPVILETPLIMLTKGQIISQGLKLGVDYNLTNSCYNPTIIPESERSGDPLEPISIPCGKCDSCILRSKGFGEVSQKVLGDSFNLHRGENVE